MDLHIIVQQYPDCLKDRKKLKSLLNDLYPEEKQYTNVALNVLECGIVEKIQHLNHVDAARLKAFTRQLESEYGLQETIAREVVILWAEAFDISVERYNYSTTKTEAHENKGTFQNDIPAVEEPWSVNGNIDDFEISQKQQGWFITKYTGFEESRMVIPSMINGRRIVGIDSEVFLGCSEIEDLVISEGIQHIYRGAFSLCRKLRSVKFPNSLKTLGVGGVGRHGAFSATSIRYLDLPGNLTHIGEWAFQNVSQLEICKMPDSVVDVQTGAFSHCHTLKKIGLSKSIIAINPYTFADCWALTEVAIPKKVKSIDAGAFSSGKSLASVYIPSKDTEIKETKYPISEVFESCNCLTIYCCPGSKAMEYARKHGIKYARIPEKYL